MPNFEKPFAPISESTGPRRYSESRSVTPRGPVGDFFAVGCWHGARYGLAAAGLTLALATGGCSTALQFDALSKNDQAEITGSIKPSPAAASAASEASVEADLANAKAAAVEVLSQGRKDASLPWESARTGAHGTVTPIAGPYSLNGADCRNFLASYVRGARESWFQGSACREARVWKVRELRSLQRT